MRLMISFIISAACLSIQGLRAEEVTAQGCIVKGVEAGCLMLMDDGKTYNVTGAKPAPKIGEHGSITGTISNNPTTCQQGTLLSPAAWKADKSKICDK